LLAWPDPVCGTKASDPERKEKPSKLDGPV